jgi:hypothetical protein
MNNIIIQETTVTITESKIAEIKLAINAKWDAANTKEELAETIKMDYIFGAGNTEFKYVKGKLASTNEHYNIDFIKGLVEEVDLEKNPLPIIKPVVEEVNNPIEIIGG